MNVRKKVFTSNLFVKHVGILKIYLVTLVIVDYKYFLIKFTFAGTQFVHIIFNCKITFCESARENLHYAVDRYIFTLSIC